MRLSLNSELLDDKRTVVLSRANISRALSQRSIRQVTPNFEFLTINRMVQPPQVDLISATKKRGLVKASKV